jgi:hypothetical protein
VVERWVLAPVEKKEKAQWKRRKSNGEERDNEGGKNKIRH